MFQTQLLDPCIHQCLPSRCLPIFFKRGMAFGTLSAAIMMTESTLKRLMTCSKQFAAFIPEKRTAIFCKLICRYRPFTSFERRRQHAKCKLGRDLQHHAISVSSIQHAYCFFNGPPAGTRAVAHA